MIPVSATFLPCYRDHAGNGERSEKEMKEMSENKAVSRENRIRELFEEVENYRQAIRNAQDALASAEMELDTALDSEYRKQQAEGKEGEK